MEFIKKYWLLILCFVAILLLIKCNYDGAGIINDLKNEEKASKEREAIYREEAKQLRIDRNKDLKKIDSLKVEKNELLREIQNIRNDEKDKLDKVDAYTTGELQQFFTDRYGK